MLDEHLYYKGELGLCFGFGFGFFVCFLINRPFFSSNERPFRCDAAVSLMMFTDQFHPLLMSAIKVSSCLSFAKINLKKIELEWSTVIFFRSHSEYLRQLNSFTLEQNNNINSLSSSFETSLANYESVSIYSYIYMVNIPQVSHLTPCLQMGWYC